jgi:peptide/nickel transport system permease protein
VSLAVGLAAMTLSVGLGALVGTLAGALRGRFDAVLMRLADAMLSIPTIFVAITASPSRRLADRWSRPSSSPRGWGPPRRARRAPAPAWKLSFVEAARAGHTLPLRDRQGTSCPPETLDLVASSLGVGTALLTESALCFWGSVQPPRQLGNS